jgi:hypothetical protein
MQGFPDLDDPGTTLRDMTLSFGLCSAPYLFNLFAEGLHWNLECYELRTVSGTAPKTQLWIAIKICDNSWRIQHRGP